MRESVGVVTAMTKIVILLRAPEVTSAPLAPHRMADSSSRDNPGIEIPKAAPSQLDVTR